MDGWTDHSYKCSFVLCCAILAAVWDIVEGMWRMDRGVSSSPHFVLALAKLSCVALKALILRDVVPISPLLRRLWIFLCWCFFLLVTRWSLAFIHCTWEREMFKKMWSNLVNDPKRKAGRFMWWFWLDKKKKKKLGLSLMAVIPNPSTGEPIFHTFLYFPCLTQPTQFINYLIKQILMWAWTATNKHYKAKVGIWKIWVMKSLTMAKLLLYTHINYIIISWLYILLYYK